MKIAIDARFLGSEGAGIGKYTEKLLEKLQEVDRENVYFILLKKSNFDLFKPKNRNFKKILVNAGWYSLKEQLLIPFVLRKLKPNLVHFTHYNVPLFWFGKFLVTIYDITKSEFGKEASNVKNPISYLIKQTAYSLIIRRAISGSLKIIAGSNSTKNKLIKRFKVDEKKITTIYAGADELYFKSEENKRSPNNNRDILKKYNIKKPFVLYVGNAFPYKNLVVILGALKLIQREIRFVYVSSRSTFVEDLIEKAKEIGVENRLIIAGFVPDEDLAILYKLAEAFIFPSLSEGFGLPGLEAMASKCPVICSDIPIFKEIYGEAAIYFNPKSSTDLASKVNLVTSNKRLRGELIKKGIGQVRKYSWDKLGQETLKTYKQLLER